MTNRDDHAPEAPSTPEREAEAQRLDARIVELTARREAAERGGVSCSNPRHPDGPYHVATPLPGSWEWPERLAQRLRRKAWGCGCRPRLGEATLLTLGNRLAITTAIQAGGSPRIDLAGTSAQIDGDETEGVTRSYRGVMVRPIAKGDRGNRPNPVATPTRGVLIATQSKGATWPLWARAVTARPADLSTVVNRVIHNVAAHPLLELCPPLGNWLHDRTAGQAFPDLDAIHGDAGWQDQAWGAATADPVADCLDAVAESRPSAIHGETTDEPLLDVWRAGRREAQGLTLDEANGFAASLHAGYPEGGDIIAVPHGALVPSEAGTLDLGLTQFDLLTSDETGRAALDLAVVAHGYHEHTLPAGYNEAQTLAYRRFMALHHGHDRLVDTDPLRLVCRTCHGSTLTLDGPPVGAEATEDLGTVTEEPALAELAIQAIRDAAAVIGATEEAAVPAGRLYAELGKAGWALLPSADVVAAITEEDRRPTLGGHVEPTGYWTLDDLPLPDGVPHALAKGAPRIALRDPEGRSWVSWLLLDALPSLRAQLESGAALDHHASDLWHALHLAREVIAAAQTGPAYDTEARRRMDVAVARIDRVGAALCPEVWSTRDIADDIARIRFGPTFPDFLAEAMNNAAAEATTALHARLVELGLDPADYTVVWDTDPVQGAPLNLLTVGATAIPKTPAPWPPRTDDGPETPIPDWPAPEPDPGTPIGRGMEPSDAPPLPGRDGHGDHDHGLLPSPEVAPRRIADRPQA